MVNQLGVESMMRAIGFMFFFQEPTLRYRQHIVNMIAEIGDSQRDGVFDNLHRSVGIHECGNFGIE